MRYALSVYYSTGARDIVTTLRKSSISYLYLPLHLLPESATLSQSNEYYEDDLIRSFASKLPVNIHILVKENPLMIGHRNISFYKRLESLSNVHVVSPQFSSEFLISNSIGVLSLSGTVILESLLLSKPVLAIGTPEFIHLVNPKYRNSGSFVDFVHDVQSKNYEFMPSLEHYIASIFQLDINLEPGDLKKIYLGSSDFELNRIADSIHSRLSQYFPL